VGPDFSAANKNLNQNPEPTLLFQRYWNRNDRIQRETGNATAVWIDFIRIVDVDPFWRRNHRPHHPNHQLKRLRRETYHAEATALRHKKRKVSNGWKLPFIFFQPLEKAFLSRSFIRSSNGF